MSKILIIASGAHIASYAYKIQKEYHAEDSLIIVSAFMENAVEYIKEQMSDDIDVIVGRGNTAKMLRAAKLPYPIVEIPITNQDIYSAVEKAASLMNIKTGKLAYIGEEKALESAKVFLTKLGYRLSLYPCSTSQDIRTAVKLAKAALVKVIIGGIFANSIATAENIPCVILEASYESVLQAYQEALAVQEAAELRKKANLESRIILENISDGILAVDRSGIIRYCNKPASEMLQCQPDPAGLRVSDLLPEEENSMLSFTLDKGKRYTQHPAKIQDLNLLLTFAPVITGSQRNGAIVTLKPQSSVVPALESPPVAVKIGFQDMLGHAQTFRFAIQTARLSASDSLPVLIVGEYGTGKAILAKAIHGAHTKRGSFIVRSGKTIKIDDFLLCQGGSLYISKVEELDAQMQEHIAQICSERCLYLESGEILHVSFKLICSTETNLKEMTIGGQFSKNLYYMLASHIIALPPLRERGTDIELLFSHFLEESGLSFSGSLRAYPWPGNIQEMKTLARRLAQKNSDKGIITKEMVERELGEDAYFSVFAPGAKSVPPIPQANKTYLIGETFYTKEDLLSLKAYYNGKMTIMARQLNCSRSTLWRYFKEIEAERAV
ncbi:transcriptional regulator containing PAS, AAA-type ATPase, and DNA-binding domains [Sphaerochaeta pleomorpha str. Grapes]|uniref:Transcriptional regulator containing PAS, AAA-type ATPase, and DNA-binding domains n=1 Tax=Sphaerochaeta pleomorpha (strain ATCC BAA-1885 / DSM 22778 / Grapes) TaxID=158190 RepID=G8QWU1_SPHPG|nr:sigma-54-dependent Fis family transcriptional regulator [Sphaerochaeta pleomorpha]AEV28385.1 transcriptional regulator containing PAS, AAA-type ATPase, and DNA-binding domains [Sphaerochaeta pleomorpha str. Grapes]